MVKYGLILFIIIIQIVLVIVSAYFIFWVYSCVFTISGHLHSSVRCTFSRIHPHLFESYPDLQPQFTNSSKWSGADFIVAHSISMSFSPKSHPWLAEVPGEFWLNMWKETLRCYFIFRCFWNAKNIRESHQHPTHRLCTRRGAINLNY